MRHPRITRFKINYAVLVFAALIFAALIFAAIVENPDNSRNKATILESAASNVGATTYYMPDDFPNLQAAFSGMQSGDTLIIRDGVYTGTENEITHTQKPPAGTSSKYTTIKAEHDGQAIFLNAPCLVSDTSYIQYEGLLWHRTVHGIGLVNVGSAITLII